MVRAIKVVDDRRKKTAQVLRHTAWWYGGRPGGGCSADVGASGCGPGLTFSDSTYGPALASTGLAFRVIVIGCC